MCLESLHNCIVSVETVKLNKSVESHTMLQQDYHGIYTYMLPCVKHTSARTHTQAWTHVFNEAHGWESNSKWQQ